MGKRPDAMEKWGAVSILKEPPRLLHRHFRLFFPFILAFQLPATLLSTYQNVFLGVSTWHPLHQTSFVNNAALAPAQEETDAGIHPPPLILTYTLLVLMVILGVPTSAAYAYIVDYIYSNAGPESNEGSITKRVLKQLPGASLRIIVTMLWVSLLTVILSIASVVFVVILCVIWTAIIGRDPNLAVIVTISMVPLVIIILVATPISVVSVPIAVLEPEKYGGAAVKRSIEYLKRRKLTIFCVVLLTSAIGGVMYAPAQAVGMAELPVWVKIVVASLLSVLYLGVNAYFELTGVVLYFVCKSSFEAVLPQFQLGNIPAAGNPYKPLTASESTQQA